MRSRRRKRPQLHPPDATTHIGRCGNAAAASWAVDAPLPPLTANLALEFAPVRVSLIAPGFADTPLSAAILGDALDERRDVTNSAIVGGAYDVDGGQQLTRNSGVRPRAQP